VLLAIAGKDLLVWKRGMSESAGDKPIKFAHARRVVVVAAHPEGKYIATGCDRGEIFLWHNILASRDSMETDAALGEERGQPFCSGNTMHWHAHAVRCLQPSADGATLLSGGEEAVLVQWQVREKPHPLQSNFVS
jgi:NET1-associated nuclear protein 1 (U3 small nucleolar RNA-associated protein 17)